MSSSDRFKGILGRVTYQTFDFRVVEKDGHAFLQLAWVAPCNDTGVLDHQKSRKWYLSPHMTDSEVVQTAFLAVMIAEEHEIRERFRFEGETVFGPHFDIRALRSLARNVEIRDHAPVA